jgi:hypothetical protein
MALCVRLIEARISHSRLAPSVTAPSDLKALLAPFPSEEMTC